MKLDRALAKGETIPPPPTGVAGIDFSVDSGSSEDSDRDDPERVFYGAPVVPPSEVLAAADVLGPIESE